VTKENHLATTKLALISQIFHHRQRLGVEGNHMTQAYRATSWQPHGTDRHSLGWPKWTLAHGFPIDENTINIILVLLLLFINIIINYYYPENGYW